MNNNYNEIALGQIGKWIDTSVEFLFVKHLWLGIIVILIIGYLLFRFGRRLNC